MGRLELPCHYVSGDKLYASPAENDDGDPCVALEVETFCDNGEGRIRDVVLSRKSVARLRDYLDAFLSEAPADD